MNNIYTDYKGNIRKGNIELFLEVVIDNYIIIRDNREINKKLLEDKRIVENPMTGEKLEIERNLDEIYRLFKTNLKLTIQSIVMLSTFFESLINEIGIIEFGQKYYKENLDKLSTIAKWEVVLKMIYGKSIDKESQYFENFKELIKTRNSLIHYKSSVLNKDGNSKHIDYFPVLDKNIKTLESFFADLDKIDEDKGILEFYRFQLELFRTKPAHNNG